LAFEHDSMMRPCRGEFKSGDTTVIVEIETGRLVAIVDVLGHGPEASVVAEQAESYLKRFPSGDLSKLIARLHEHLRGTRGAAVGLCVIDESSGELEYVGTGNTTLRRFGSKETRLVSQDGILGQNMRTPRPQTLQLEAGDVVVLYTDGVKDRFSLDDYRGILHHDTESVARNIVSRFGKDHDDAACIAIRWTP